MSNIVKVNLDDVTLFDGYGYIVNYKEAKDVFTKISDEIKTSIMSKTVLAFYLTNSICHKIISVERIDSIKKYMIEHPDIPYYKWEGCTFTD